MEERIVRLYAVFKRYDRPKDFPACECCLSAEKKAGLLRATLDELGTDDIDDYAADAFLTVGSLADFKYFLPRILDLAVHEEFSWPDPEVSLAKLRLAEWESWPEEERAAILGLLQEKFRCLLDDPKSGGRNLDKWVCALGQCFSDITPYLDQLFEPGREEKLWGFIEANMSVFTKDRLGNAFWDSAPEGEKQVRAWLNRPEVKALLSDRYGMRFQSSRC